MPRRYADYLPEYTSCHQLSPVGSWILVSALLLMFWNLPQALFGRARPPATTRRVRPRWGGTLTLPPVLNFDGEPDLSRGPYEYATRVER